MSVLDNIQNERLRGIAMQSARNYEALLVEQEDDLLELLQESEDRVTISHSVTIDLAKNKQADKVSFSMKHSLEAESEIRDPNQLLLAEIEAHQNEGKKLVELAEKAGAKVEMEVAK
ncbi:hypothetical protein [Roseibacillus ishigakijimensis]|uniref:Uncharacterized protein n=1 Tax=Roseibacillus ishigakijimensis TaxID=454146 RepID=A0A934VN81_9BACT|nr:hypothetical protein [Roseibacillus ishigakijimensis]MBK1835037.1 hypothetical protein [Roseibacillus ishigakijimensis]